MLIMLIDLFNILAKKQYSLYINSVYKNAHTACLSKSMLFVLKALVQLQFLYIV